MQRYFNNVTNRTGDVLPGAAVTVTVTATGALATIYSDDGITPASNPITSDSNGFFAFYAADGEYDLTFNGAGFGPFTISGILLADVAVQAAAAAASAAAAQQVVTDISASGGSALVGFVQSGTGAVSRTAQDKMRESVSVLDFGAVGDGVTDDTAALQAFLDAAGHLHLGPKTYVTLPLLVRSNTTLHFHPLTVLKAKTGYAVTDRLLRIEGVDNVTILGNGGAVQMLKAEYVADEQRHGVNISASTNVRVYDLNSNDSGGDGFYIGGTTKCENVALINCNAKNNRRQGLSITNVVNCLILGGIYRDTVGTAPECGIDIESNLADGYYLQNVSLIGVRTYNNKGGGILISPQSKFAPVSIYVKGCTSEYDGDAKGGLGLIAAMAYQTGTDPALIGKILGQITAEDCTIINPQGSGIVSTNWTENAPQTKLKNIYVLNAYSNGAVAALTRNQSGLRIRGETPSTGTFGTSVGNIEVDGITVVDNRAVPLNAIPVYLEPGDEAAKPLKNIRIKNIKAVKAEWTSASLTPVLRSGSLAATNVAISYDDEWIVTSVSKTMVLPDAGAIFTNTAGATYTLPTAGNFIGSSFTFRVTVASAALQVLTSGSDVIANYTAEAATQIIGREIGSQITVKATAAGIWQVINVVGGWGVKNYFGQRYPTTFNSAAPTTGTWKVGDLVYNVTPTAGGFVGWVCTTAGTPGTWKTFGAITP